MTINEKVAEVRKMMKAEGLDAYMVNGSDPHNSEYPCPRWETRKFISGFTGSAGTVVITKDKALLWVDSRYFIQGAKQIQGTVFELVKDGIDNNPTPSQWLAINLQRGATVGLSADTLMIGEMERMNKAFDGIKVVPSPDFLQSIWGDRPSIPEGPVVELGENITGLSRKGKLQRIRLYLHQRDCQWFLVSSLDDIAWTMNLRGNDVVDTPVFLSFMLIGLKESYLFTSEKRFSKEIRSHLTEDVTLLPYEDAFHTCDRVIGAGDTVLLDKGATSSLFKAVVDKAEIIDEMNITTRLKAEKNEIELEGERRAHLIDGVAMVNFLSQLDFAHPDYDEYGLAQKIDQQRARSDEFTGLSFGTISGYQDNGALCHYSATKESSKKVVGHGLLVLDSGGHYTTGTTDITRTLLFGEATDEEKRDYTLVLKGHLALARQRFPVGTRGVQLDILAKQYMWQYGLTFYHGTGHGVGHRLCVHEGPQRISSALIDEPLQVGMVTSDEPGLYVEGKHGIRIENLLVVKEDEKTEFGQFLGFEVLTLCPYERRLIDLSLLSNDEIHMIDTYHAWVRDELVDKVDETAVEYLMEATEPLQA